MSSNRLEETSLAFFDSSELKVMFICTLPFVSTPLTITSTIANAKTQLQELLSTPGVKVYEYVFVPTWQDDVGLIFTKCNHEEFLNGSYEVLT